MKSFEPTEHKIRKEKKRGNLLKMEFTASIIGMVCQLGLILFLAKNYILDSINSLVDNSFDLPSRIKLLIGNLFSSILISTSTFAAFQVLIFVILNKGLWTRSESRFQPGGNFKTFFSSFRKALIQLVFMVLFTLVVVFVCRQGILTQKEVIVVSIVGLGLFLCLCFLEISIEPVLYKKKLMMDYKELKDEMRETEGDPFIKHSMRQMHRAMLYEEVKARIRACKYIVIG